MVKEKILRSAQQSLVIARGAFLIGPRGTMGGHNPPSKKHILPHGGKKGGVFFDLCDLFFYFLFFLTIHSGTDLIDLQRAKIV